MRLFAPGGGGELIEGAGGGAVTVAGMNSATGPAARSAASPIPALSVSQPYAHALLHLGKDCENRRWSTSYRGRIWVHAPKSVDRRPLPDGVAVPDRLEFGVILGSVEVYDVVRGHASPWSWGALTDDGRPLYQWLVRDPRPLAEPVPALGALKLWWPNPELAFLLPPGHEVTLSRV